jgi:hypothetical protein
MNAAKAKATLDDIAFLMAEAETHERIAKARRLEAIRLTAQVHAAITDAEKLAKSRLHRTQRDADVEARRK